MIIIIGAGAFGQTISKLLNTEHKLIDVEPDGTYSTESIALLKKATRLILCVPTTAVSACARMIKPHIKETTPLLSCTKGIYERLQTPSDIINQTITNPVAALTGPHLSNELKAGKPAIAIIAGDQAEQWKPLFDSNQFSVTIEQDRQGIELGGALKNVAALGIGLIHGYYGKNSYNTMGSLIGFINKDINTLYNHKHSKELPQLGYLSDLFATCMSEHSRNHKHGHKTGEALANDEPRPEQTETVEGLHTLTIAHEYVSKNNINAPAITALYHVFFKNGSITDLLKIWR